MRILKEDLKELIRQIIKEALAGLYKPKLSVVGLTEEETMELQALLDKDPNPPFELVDGNAHIVMLVKGRGFEEPAVESGQEVLYANIRAGAAPRFAAMTLLDAYRRWSSNQLKNLPSLERISGDDDFKGSRWQ